MKFFLVIFIALLALVTIGILVVFYYVGKGIRYFRRFSTGETSGEEFESMANKYYRKQDDLNERFGDDYFKGSGWQQKGPSGQQQQAPGQGQNRQRRQQTTSDGVTIEDRRDPTRANKKIFARDEGEYVDFTEN